MYPFENLRLFFTEVCRCRGDSFPDNLCVIAQLKNRLPVRRCEEEALKLLSLREPADIRRLIDMPGRYGKPLAPTAFQSLILQPEYVSYQIPRKKGGRRDICAPAPSLKAAQRDINRYLQNYYRCIRPEGVFGFTVKPDAALPARCNIVENAAPHVNRRFVLNMDLKDFFPSISARRVLALFRSELFGFNEPTAAVLTLLLTYRGQLPVGAPTSPALSNFVCIPMDRELAQFCRSHQLTRTRYADDLTFSSDRPITREHISGLIQIIQKHGFCINHRKFRLQSAYRQQTVTGIVVNKKINLDRKKLKKIRAMLHDFKYNGPERAAAGHFRVNRAGAEQQALFVSRLRGYIGFVGQVRGKECAYYLRMKHDFETAMALSEDR
jgi:RNA-directed DNA polymerase